MTTANAWWSFQITLQDFGVNDDTVESFWVKIMGKANKVDIIVEFYNRPPSQVDATHKLFYKKLRDTSRSSVFILMGDFNFARHEQGIPHS